MIKKIDYDYVKNNNKTIVFLHGWGLDKSVFDRLVHFFYKDYSVLNLSFPGFGKSENPNDYYDTYEYAYQIFLLISELEINEVVIVGHSFGGRVAIILSSVFGVKVGMLVLTASAGLNRFSLSKSVKVVVYKIKKFLCRINIIKKEKLLNEGSSDYKKLSPVMKRVFVRVVNEDLGYLLKNIDAKTYLVWDKKDKETPYWICKKLYKNISHSKVVLFRSGGHFVCFVNINKFCNMCIKYLNSDTN